MPHESAFSGSSLTLHRSSLNPCRAKQADQAVGLQFEASLANGVMANNRNELSHRTARNAKRHTSAVEKAKRASAGNNKIKELRAELAILVAESKVS